MLSRQIKDAPSFRGRTEYAALRPSAVSSCDAADDLVTLTTVIHDILGREGLLEWQWRGHEVTLGELPDITPEGRFDIVRAPNPTGLQP